MWKNGGLTEDDNLITLCHTCHKGLDPHEDFDLFELIDPLKFSADVEGARRQLYERIKHYRAVMTAASENGNAN